ncbi:MAG: D-alanine--D-alanine ligase [Isosphaera sp.]|nr:D-alanine--D-alanine ligase [Isosphaera sp.]
MKPPVLVLFNNPVLPPDHPEAGSEHDILDTVADIAKVLAAAGFDARKLGVDRDPRPLLDELRRRPPLAVFNLFEGLATRPGTEVSVAALLEWLDVPFTGCPSPALVLGRDKIRAKHLLAAAGLPTPAYAVVERPPAPDWGGGWPAIVKPAMQDASIGIDQASVVTDAAQLAARVDHTLAAYGPPVLVERFVTGREFHVNVFEDGPDRTPTVLPLAEIAFRPAKPGRWPVYTFTAKWDEASDEYADCPLVAPVELPPADTARLADLARRAFRLLDCRDYARLDVRMDAAGDFHVLEVNPNPYLNSLALVKGLEAVGRTHEWFVVKLMLDAIGRGGNAVPPGSVTVPVGVVTGA